MNRRLKILLEEYAELERGVQALVGAQCRDICGLCTVACCCRTDLCEEALESPFLRLLHKRADLESDAYGFLTESGCALPVGRPPVCYEFFCDEVLEAQPDDLHRQLLRILGRLPGHVSERLAEITDEAELDGLDFQCLEKQMQESFQCLEILKDFFSAGIFPDAAAAPLRCIRMDDAE